MQPLTVATFNIRFAGSADDAADRAWEARRGAVVNAIRKWSRGDAPLTVVGLQECLKRQYNDILWLLNETEHSEAWVGVFAGRDDGKDSGEACAVIWRKDWLRCERTATFWLSEKPDVPGSKATSTRLPRISTLCVFTDTRPGRSDSGSFALFNTHLDHENGRSRVLGVETVLNKGVKELLSTSLPSLAGIVIMGDFNSPPAEDDVHGRLRRAGFVDTAAAYAAASTAPAAGEGAASAAAGAGGRRRSVTTQHQPTFHNWTGATSSTGVAHDCIDYIYAKQLQAGKTGVTVDMFAVDTARYPSSTSGSGEQRAVWPSDHFPVVATLRF